MTGSNREEDNDERKEVEKDSSGSTLETMCQKQQHKSNTLHKVN